MSARPRWEIPVVAAAATVIGLVCGMLAAGGAGGEAAPAGAGHPPVLPPATLTNLGVRVAEIQPGEFRRTVAVAAVAVDTPTTEQPVFAPIGGRVERIEVQVGTAVEPGRTVVTLVRDPLPRPQLTLTADVLRPAQEQLHQTVLDLRRSAEEVRIAATELERVEQYTGTVGGRDLPIVPRQRAIDLRYELARSEKALEQARLELQKHGLSGEQIAAVGQGAPLPEFTEETWQRALARNGLWPAAAQQLSGALPQSLRELPWVTATVGELAASGLATAELTQWIATSGAAEHFLDIGVLLQRGHTLADVRRLHELNALEPVVEVQAPPLDEGAAWDVVAIGTRPGAHVAAGEALLTLADPRRLLLRTEPVGSEVAAILTAAAGSSPIRARPLIAGAGPVLEGLTVGYVQSAREHEGTVAFLEVENTVRAEIDRGEGAKSRTWEVRAGVRYLLQVPTATLENVYVLPSAAVTQHGADQVVFLRDGDGFRPVPVAIAHRDDEVVVIPATKEVALFPGDPVVQSGAFELGLALLGGDALDPHAGHSH